MNPTPEDILAAGRRSLGYAPEGVDEAAEWTAGVYPSGRPFVALDTLIASVRVVLVDPYTLRVWWAYHDDTTTTAAFVSGTSDLLELLHARGWPNFVGLCDAVCRAFHPELESGL